MDFAPIVKAVRAYNAEEWELFIREWVKGLNHYAKVEKLGGSGDLGRDVIGLCDSHACEGVWDNYQCKHYDQPLSVPQACEDAGKIIFHAYMKKFVPPRAYYFIAPRGVSTKLRDMLLNPSKFKDEVVSTWDTRVAKNVVAGEVHLLTGDLAKYIDEYDFTTFSFSSLPEILDEHKKTAYWAERFGGLLPPPPAGVTPIAIGANETVYVSKLLALYAEELGYTIVAEDIGAHPVWKDHFQKQRERFYSAEAFIAHYRDQTQPGTVESFQEQIHDAIEPVMTIHTAATTRLSMALSAAASTSVASVLASQAKVGIKQGVCHQLANADLVSWVLT
jgi:hypothetical protein